MVYRRFGLLKYLTPCVAVAAFVLGCAARASETATPNNSSAFVAGDPDGMSWCRVSAEKVNMRVGPNTSTQIFSTLRSGEYIRAKSVQKDWLEMEWPKNVPAWVLKESVSSADGKAGVVRAAKARIMGLGSNSAPELAVLDHNAHVMIVGEQGDWYRVQAPSAARAYVSAKFVVVGVQAPAETVTLPPDFKTPSKIQHERAAEPVALPQSPRTVKETEATPADVVTVMQHEVAWPKSTVQANGFKRASEAPAKVVAIVEPPVKSIQAPVGIVATASDDSMFAPAIPVAQTRNGIDGQLAQAAAAKVKAEQLELTRLAAAERKRADAAELARSTAEARRIEIETQTRDAAELKRSLESEIAKLSDARKKAEAEEALRQTKEKKRLEEVESARLAVEDRRKLDLMEQSRLASERKKLEDSEKEHAAVETRKKVEIETQTQAVAAKKKVLEEELARLSDAKKKAELDEQHRLASEKKRLAEAESARIAAEAKKAELEEQALKAAEKKKALEIEIGHLADAKKKEEQDALARAAREKKLIADAEVARQEIEARRKSETEELAKKEADKKRLDAADAIKSAADAKRRAELADQERAAIARKQVLEAEIAKLDAEKQKYEKDALLRVAAEKKDTQAAETARLASEKKQAEVVELTKLVSEKKRLADEETARAASEMKRADAAETARIAAEKKHAQEAASAKIAQEAARQATERKQTEELAAQKAATLKHEAEEAAKAATARKEADVLAAKAASERKRAEEADLARLALEKKRVEDEAAKIAGESARKIEQEKVRQESARKLAELEQARTTAEKVAAANKALRLPDLADESAPAAKSVALVTDKTIMLNENDLALEKGEPTERNYNSNYLPQSVMDVKKRYIVPTEVPKRAQIVAETIDVDMPIPTSAAKIEVVPMAPPAAKQANATHAGETVELAPRNISVQRAPVGPAVVNVTDSNFAAEIENFKGTVLIDFSATWCGPCQRLAPTVHELAEEFRGRLKVVKIDVDQAPNAARRYGAYSIPLLVMVKDGRTLSQQVGARSREELQSWMQNHAETPTRSETPANTEVISKPKSVGMRITPVEQRSTVSDVGTLERIGNVDIEGVKYLLRLNGAVTRYIIEPPDVDMTPLVGRSITITGKSIGRSFSDVSVIQMKSASTFG